MGRDKALLPFREGALAQSVARVVGEAADSATLIGKRGRYGALGYAVIPDLHPGEGPLGGILTALSHSAEGHLAAWNLIIARDLPKLEVEMLRGSIGIASRCEADAL